MSRAAAVGAATGLLIALLSGCATPAGTSAGQDPARESLLAADRQFSALSTRVGAAAAFHYFLADDATVLPQNEMPRHGRATIFEAMKADDGARLTWVPEFAEASHDGTLGWTWGFYEVRFNDAQGHEAISHGKYLTVWRRQPDGAWRVVGDTGNKNPKP